MQKPKLPFQEIAYTSSYRRIANLRIDLADNGASTMQASKRRIPNKFRPNFYLDKNIRSPKGIDL